MNIPGEYTDVFYQNDASRTLDILRDIGPVPMSLRRIEVAFRDSPQTAVVMYDWEMPPASQKEQQKFVQWAINHREELVDKAACVNVWTWANGNQPWYRTEMDMIHNRCTLYTSAL